MSSAACTSGMPIKGTRTDQQTPGPLIATRRGVSGSRGAGGWSSGQLVVVGWPGATSRSVYALPARRIIERVVKLVGRFGGCAA